MKGSWVRVPFPAFWEKPYKPSIYAGLRAFCFGGRFCFQNVKVLKNPLKCSEIVVKNWNFFVLCHFWRSKSAEFFTLVFDLTMHIARISLHFLGTIFDLPFWNIIISYIKLQQCTIKIIGKAFINQFLTKFFRLIYFGAEIIIGFHGLTFYRIRNGLRSKCIQLVLRVFWGDM